MVLVEITEEEFDMKLPKGKKHINLSLLRKSLSHINLYTNNLVLGTHMISNTLHSENSYAKSKFNLNFRNSNQKEPKKKWVPKEKIIYVADVLNSSVETPVMVPGLWMLTTYDGKKVYVPKSGT